MVRIILQTTTISALPASGAKQSLLQKPDFSEPPGARVEASRLLETLEVVTADEIGEELVAKCTLKRHARIAKSMIPINGSRGAL